MKSLIYESPVESGWRRLWLWRMLDYQVLVIVFTRTWYYAFKLAVHAENILRNVLALLFLPLPTLPSPALGVVLRGWRGSVYMEFLFVGQVKGKVYSNNRHTIEELKTNITMRLWKSHKMNWQKLPETLLKRAELCVQVHGEQFQHLL